MQVHEIINTDIAPLNISDTVGLALTKLDLLHVTRFPVIEDGKLIGLVDLETLIEVEDESIILHQIPIVEAISIQETHHLFEASRKMLTHELYLLPVVDFENNFVGVLKKRDLLQAIGEVFNLESFGSVLTIQMNPFDFTLTEIIRLIEIEGAKILGIAVEQPNDVNGFYRVSIKLNLEDSSNVSATLTRYGYVITSEVSSASLESNFSERADELIRYLDL